MHMDPGDAAVPTMPTPLTVEQILADYLDDEALEQLICVYLQNRFGYLMRTGAPRPASYDYILRNTAHNEAVVHARGGDTLVARDAYSLPTSAVDHVFVFSPTNTYGPDPAPNVREIDAEDLIDFIRTESWSLPQSLSEWIERAADEELACRQP
jgi:hypothetical protein